VQKHADGWSLCVFLELALTKNTVLVSNTSPEIEPLRPLKG